MVVLDNLSSHKGVRVRELVGGRGCELLFLPPYSPDSNPIEEVFSQAKALGTAVGAVTGVMPGATSITVATACQCAPHLVGPSALLRDEPIRSLARDLGRNRVATIELAVAYLVTVAL
jgi:hypothetical protein